MTFHRALLVVLTAGVLVTAGCGKKEEAGPTPTVPDAEEGTAPVAPAAKSVKVGVILPETGGIATYGQDTRRGIELAVSEANAKNAVKLELIFRDNESKSGKSQDLMTELVTLHKVQAVLGAVSSGATRKMVHIAKAKEIPIITPASTADDVTLDNPYVFRVCYTDTYQGRTMARFARDVLGAERAAVLEESGNPYSEGLSKSFQEFFKELGGEIESVRSFGSEDQDFSAHLNHIRTLRGGQPDVVAVPAYYNAVGKILRQAREKGLTKPRFIGSDGWDSQELYELAEESAKGHYFANHFALEDPDPNVRSFVAAHEQAYPKAGPPSALTALGYDAALTLAEAVNRATALTGPAIRDAIAETKDLTGVTGKITIDADGNALKDIIILETGTDRSIFKMRYPAAPPPTDAPAGDAE